MKSSAVPSDPAAVTYPTTLRSVDLRGPAGRLEALLNEGAPDSHYAALVCHPHPLGGGTLHNKVVYHAMKVLNGADFGFRLPVLRFNFRGTGLSEGHHEGLAESADVSAALDWLKSEFNLPIIVVGFSFGAAMALVACCGTTPAPRAQVHALAALGLPTQGFGHQFHYPFLADCKTPKLFLSGDRDWFAPKSDLERVVATAADPKDLVFIPTADHSFTGHLELMQRSLASWLASSLKDEAR
ncbi:alpha/beta hydrolase [Occallatibacter savannae]|uniref:alpha/beta hydrolase n=1 Tax=Occallatibacter savannae TaxID=1002691 RepID=UPI000D690D2A|nr:alpha/beta fold hydrolase [Occallatibacter savannae]